MSKTLKIDLNRFVTKKYFRETIGLTPANLSNWIKRDGKIKTKVFKSIELELIDLDSIDNLTFAFGGSVRDSFYKEKEKWRLKKRKNDLLKN